MRKISKLPWLWRDFGWQLRTSRRRVCLDQNWMFVDRGEEGGGGPKFRFFCWRRHKWMASHQIIFCYWRFLVVVVVVLFCFSLLLYSLHLHTLFHCCMLIKEIIIISKKKRGRTNLKINLKIHYTLVSFPLIEEVQTKLSTAKNSCIGC